MKCLNASLRAETLTSKAFLPSDVKWSSAASAVFHLIWENRGPLCGVSKLMIVIILSVYILQAGVKAKKATETYKSYVEKYATAKSEFEQKMAETAQVL